MPQRRLRSIAPRLLRGELLEKRTCLAAFTLTSVLDNVTEGNAAEFRVTMDAPSMLPQSVIVSSEAGTATLGVDYMHRTQELLFFPGETEKTFYVQSLTDPANVTEGAETLTVFVTPRGGTPSQLSAIVTINDYVAPDPYTIEFTFDDSVPGSVRALFPDAAAVWEDVIIGDLPDVTLPSGIVVDDLLINVAVVSASDLPAGAIAGAYFTDIRVGKTGVPADGNFSQNGLPYIGEMVISSDYVTAVGLGYTIAHEIGHVIGVGSLWSRPVGTFSDLVTGIGTDDPVYLGRNAVREYNTIFGNVGSSVPLYNISGFDPPAYDGSYGSHWRDSVFNKYENGAEVYGELMAATYEVDGQNGVAVPLYLSRVTVGALDDFGYAVNYRGAEAYVPPSGSVGGGVGGGGGLVGGGNGQYEPDGGDNAGPGGGGPGGGNAPGVPTMPPGGVPGSGSPGAPGNGGPGAPGIGFPGNGGPGAPGIGFPGNGGPGAPGIGFPGKGGPGAPGIGFPGNGGPGAPGIGFPGKGGPGAPSIGFPGNGGPGAPSIGFPGNVGPVAPGIGLPGIGEPFAPGVRFPGIGLPVAPGGGFPGIGVPVVPGIGAPGDGGPAEPEDEAPDDDEVVGRDGDEDDTPLSAPPGELVGPVFDRTVTSLSGTGIAPASGNADGQPGTAHVGRRATTLPARISYPDQAPVILPNGPDAQDRIRRSLDAVATAPQLSPIELTHLSPEHIALLAAWADYDPWVAAGRPQQFAGARLNTLESIGGDSLDTIGLA